MFRRRFLQFALTSGSSATFTSVATAFAQDAARDDASGRPVTRMNEGRASITAQSTATLRAAHQLLDHPRVLNDPLALRIIGAEAELSLRAPTTSAERLAGLRALVVMRSRYAEDELARAVERGVRQYVILGAGLDTFAYRNPYPVSSLRVFEVDHPATQSWKRARLQEAGISIPDSLSFAPVDFETQTLTDGLRRVGFKTGEPAFVSLLGVVIYLTREATMDTLKWVAALPSGSEVVFDYALPSTMLSERERAARELLAGKAASIGEPWLTYFEPRVLSSELRQLGFKYVDDLGPSQANDRYFKDRQDGFRIRGAAHLMKAGV